ncbi:hypothetical protein [Nonomuraea cavernae]|uniref:Uncharacterized protein n=1 Tax=Nonomuraea cavernae TaxID=2045107 RepID=A0A917YSM1_9ACTN|nr:hypothetical protein [Nonomuraea cavernae]MCA2184674.1 hypothetical protein [Nonomuraea cavernae]GGO63098.1 hypothetical protein GCM10012289_09230 [Nonomuraea cavernae]
MIKTLGVDFDGVIHRYSKGWFDGTIYDEPMPGAFNGLRLLMQRYAMFIHTARSARQVAEWLAKHGFETCVEDEIHAPMKFWTDRDRLLVTNRKLPATAYLDDRAVKFTSWELALAELLPKAAKEASSVGDDQVLVPVEDLRRAVQLARCHAESFSCTTTTTEDLAAVQRLLGQVGSEKR